MAWCNLDFTFDLAVVTVTFKSCLGFISETVRCWKLIFGYLFKITFYCATIAYHVGLNALLVAARHRRPTLEKNKHAVGSAS